MAALTGARRLLVYGAMGSGVWVADDKLNDGTLTRNFRTLYAAARTAVDYKFRFTPENMDGRSFCVRACLSVRVLLGC